MTDKNKIIPEARSGINMANLDEVLAAEDSAKWTVLAGQNQYWTPEWLAEHSNGLLPNREIRTVFDPQCGQCNLLNHGFGEAYYIGRYGMDIDNRTEQNGYGKPRVLSGVNCVDMFDAIHEIKADLMFDVFDANPPFGKRWTWNGKVIDSTAYTWQMALRHGRQGVFISNHKTCERLGIDKHPFVVDYTVRENLWKNCDVICGVAVWNNPNAAEATPKWEVEELWKQLAEIAQEERANRPDFNVWLGRDGKLLTYLSTRAKLKHKLSDQDILRLHSIKGSHPLALTTERPTRKLLKELCDTGVYKIQDAAKQAIEDALASVNKLACPIMPVTDFEAVAYADEEDHLICKGVNDLGFIPGKKYELTTASYSFTEEFTRNKVHYNKSVDDETGEETEEVTTEVHTCSLTGQDRYIELNNNDGGYHRFQDRPRKGVTNEHPESRLWEIFNRPDVRTIAEVNPEEVERNKQILRTCEMLAGYKYYPGQVEYLARVSCKESALIAAATGVGKSLMAISLIAMKAPYRALLIAPQGTMRSSEEGDDDEGQEYQASQWLTEIQRFAPYLQVFQLFSMKDYQRILNANGGQLPAGVYVSYFQACFQNGARENCPPSWDDLRLEKELQHLTGTGTKLPPHEDDIGERAWCDTVGHEKNGIRCIIEPCMATQIGHSFDMVIVDEAHFASNSTANVTQMLIRLQPRYKYALTASPIPNIITNLFYLMGWLSVQDWYKGDRRNAAWPYAREEIGRFELTFLAKERDHTQERINKAHNPEWKGKCEKPSPVISSPARLLKLIRPTLAYISKEAVNPNYVPAKIVDIRVPMGTEQAVLYGFFLNRSNIPCRHPLVRARKQIAYLRAICADPAGFEHGGPRVLSNFNPKTTAILELIAKIMQEGEQVVVVGARVGQTNTLAMKLRDAGVPYSRIDSTMPPDQHAAQSNLFKAGKTRVMLMGIRCAVGHSYPNCPYEIVSSLEYSYGSLDQARGRVDRVNSTKPRTIYCVLNKTSIEELMFDIVMTKGDAAQICLRGQRVARDFKPVDISEVLASAIDSFKGEDGLPHEADLESKWADLKKKLAP